MQTNISYLFKVSWTFVLYALNLYFVPDVCFLYTQVTPFFFFFLISKKIILKKLKRAKKTQRIQRGEQKEKEKKREKQKTKT